MKETPEYVVHPILDYIHHTFSIFSADSLTESISPIKLQELGNESRYIKARSFRKCTNRIKVVTDFRS